MSAAEGPCDILKAAGQPCVAAHSTTRALYSGYDGALYVLQKPNMQRMTIGVTEAGGFADAATHDKFCGPMKDCVILSVLDQSPMGNHLTARHKLVNASQHPIHVGDGVRVYGMYFDPGYGYHVDNTKGIAKGNEPESIYAVMSGTHYNGGCCFECALWLLRASCVLQLPTITDTVLAVQLRQLGELYHREELEPGCRHDGSHLCVRR
jgi:hypothetical protein